MKSIFKWISILFVLIPLLSWLTFLLVNPFKDVNLQHTPISAFFTGKLNQQKTPRKPLHTPNKGKENGTL